MRTLLIFSVSALVLFAAIAVMSSSLVSYVAEKTLPDFVESNVLSQTAEVNQVVLDSQDNQQYTAAWFQAEPQNLVLIANFDKKMTANDLVRIYECQNAVNAGFYDKQNKPLGLFISQERSWRNFVKNRIMNGILSVNRFDTPRITRDLPRDPLVNAVQTGPILIENDEVLSVTIDTDKNARRSVAAIDGNNRLYFISIFSKSSGFRGPRLDELPQLIKDFETRTDIDLADAINLDGGSASYFKTQDLVLSEISPIGALFCETSD